MSRLRELYQDLSDYLVYVELRAPNFPPEDKVTIERAFERMFHWLGDIRESEKNEGSLHWLGLCFDQLAAAHKAYLLDKDQPTGIQRIQQAEKDLDNAKKRVPRFQQPDFIVGPSGDVRSNPLKGPEEKGAN